MADASRTDLFALAEKRLAWVEQRQALLARNVANADTPGWRTHDMKPFTAVLGAASVTPALTDPRHMALPGARGATIVSRGSERSPDGNTVSLDKELAKIADTETTHQLVTDLYLKYQGLLRTALGH